MTDNQTTVTSVQDDFEQKLNRSFVNWFGWKVLLPLLLIMSIYALIRFILEMPDSFGRAFAHGDLLVFSALVLLEAATEGEHLQKESTKMMLIRLGTRILAILLIVWFVATKSDILHKENDLLVNPNQSGHEMLTKKMLAYSCLNCAVALFSVVGSTLFFWFNVHREKKRQFESIGQAKPG
jgi:hypothetical protein